LIFNGLHAVLSQKIVFFITTTVRTSDPTRAYLIVVEMDRFYADSHLVWNACRSISEVRVPLCVADQQMIGWWESQSTDNGYAVRCREILL
jgi:hypothetical protein